MSDYRMSAIIGGGMTICGIPPRLPLVTYDRESCPMCDTPGVLRKFSGSGWYEDDWLCQTCGEDVGTGYHPFERGWRQKNIARATEWSRHVLTRDEFESITRRLVREEMGWDE